MAKSSRSRRRKRQPDFPWRLVIIPLLILVGGIATLLFLAIDLDSITENIDREADKWQISYWRKPVPLQGSPPKTHLEPTRGLYPENCGVCHIQQFKDWQSSLHSKAMGPGVTGQFPSMNFVEESGCLECHAPMSEQWKLLRGKQGNWNSNESFETALKSKGLVCSACHLRNHMRFAPPLAEGKAGTSQAIHGQPARTPHFEASEFCKGCHQHPTTSLSINGKLIENTYQEWLRSSFPEKGVTCQKCHMPERRHFWKGIHDPEMTLSGVTITSHVSPEKPLAGKKVEATLTIKNTGTGHAFPTYTTPAVILKAAFLDKEGQVLPGGFYEEKIIQRRLDMSFEPWGEQFDTRILPGKSESLTFAHQAPAEAKSLYLWIWVEPDHFYTGFYRTLLDRGSDFAGAGNIKKALEDSLASHYLLFSRTIPIYQ